MMGKPLARSTNAYIAVAPKETQAKLRQVRAAIRSAAPNAKEGISYMMPCYDRGRVAWFGLMKTHIGLYIRPPIIQEHKKELRGYETTKSVVRIPLNKKVPVALIKRLVKARIRKNAELRR